MKMPDARKAPPAPDRQRQSFQPAPRVLRWLASGMAVGREREFVLGDIDEAFTDRAGRHGRHAATRWYWRQVTGLAVRRLARRRAARPAVRHKGDSIMRATLQDLGYAVRLLSRQPSYAAVAILSLALAIGANGLVYGLVDTMVLNPFQFPEPDRLVSIGSAFPKLNQPEGFIEQHSTLEVEDFRRAETLRPFASFDIGNRAISNGNQAERLLTALVLDDPLPALGRPAHLGRGFTADELAPGGPPVAIVSHRIWRGLFSSDAGIVGRVVQVNSEPRTVVGVMDSGTSLLGTDMWIPWGGDPLLVPRNRRQFTVVARLAPGRTLDDANAELRTIAGRTTTEHAARFPEYEGWRLRAVPWAEAVTGQARGFVGLLLGAGVLVLLVACANLSSLMLARLSGRRREIAVRYALGAGGWQVTRLLLFESLLLASAAGVLGAVVAYVAMGPLSALMPDRVVSALTTPAINTRALLYCAAAAIAAALITTLVPAWQARRADTHQALRESGAGAGGGRQRLRRTLVVAELALAVVLLIGAGQMLVSFARVQQSDAGFDMQGVATMRLTLAAERYGQADLSNRFFNELVNRVAALPGVTAAAAASQFPPAENFRIQFTVVGREISAETIPTAFVNTITPGYFEVLGIPLRHGRLLGPGDRDGAPMAALVNEAFVRRFLDGRPEGRLLVGRNQDPVEIVGVVGDARNRSMLRPADPEMFATIDQVGGSNQYFVLARTTGDPDLVVAPIRKVLSELDPDQPLYAIQSMETAVAGALFPQRVSLVLVGVFAVGAMLVAALGVYGVVAFFVASRTREIGIRVALGATAGRITRVIVGQTMWLLVAGAVLGVAGGAYVASLASRLLYESPAVDVSAVAGVLGVLVFVGLLASWFPSRRAHRVDPIRALRID